MTGQLPGNLEPRQFNVLTVFTGKTESVSSSEKTPETLSSEKLNSPQTVKSELSNKPEKADGRLSEFIKDAKGPALEITGRSLIGAGVAGAILLAPLAVGGAIIGAMGAKIAKEMRLAPGNEDKILTAGLVIGSFGSLGITLIGNEMRKQGESIREKRENAVLQQNSQPKVLSESEQKLKSRVDNYKNQIHQGIVPKAEVKEKSNSFKADLKAQRKEGMIEKENYKELKMDIKDLKKQIKVGKENLKNTVDKLLNERRNQVNRIILVNSLVSEFPEGFRGDEHGSIIESCDKLNTKIEEIVESRKKDIISSKKPNEIIEEIVKSRKKDNDLETSLKLGSLPVATPAQGTFKSLEEFKEKLSNGKNEEEKAIIKQNIKILEKFADPDDNSPKSEEAVHQAIQNLQEFTKIQAPKSEEVNVTEPKVKLSKQELAQKFLNELTGDFELRKLSVDDQIKELESYIGKIQNSKKSEEFKEASIQLIQKKVVELKTQQLNSMKETSQEDLEDFLKGFNP